MTETMIPMRKGIIVYPNTTTVAKQKKSHERVLDVSTILQVFRSLIDKCGLNYKSSKHNPYV